ncbi:MAG: hypothetical protein U0610_12015 [bacterium]
MAILAGAFVVVGFLPCCASQRGLSPSTQPCSLPPLVDTSGWVRVGGMTLPPDFQPAECQADECETWAGDDRPAGPILSIDRGEFTAESFAGYEACALTVNDRRALFFAGSDPWGRPRVALWFYDGDGSTTLLYTVRFERPNDTPFARTLLLCAAGAPC